MANEGRNRTNVHHAPASGLEAKKHTSGQYSTENNPRMMDGHREERQIPNHQEEDHPRRMARDMGTSRRGHCFKGVRGY